MKFPYRQYEVEPSPTVPDGLLYRPMIRIRAIGLTGDASFWVLVDTGADETILPMSIGLAIGPAMDDAITWTIGGIAGQTVHATLGQIQLEIAQRRTTYSWKACVGFIDFSPPEDEVAILGNASFLNFFSARFDGAKHELTLKPTTSFPSM